MPQFSQCDLVLALALLAAHASAQQQVLGPYTYDGAGSISAIGTDAYAYDGVSRLVRAQVTSAGVQYTQTFAYLSWGQVWKPNLTRLTILG